MTQLSYPITATGTGVNAYVGVSNPYRNALVNAHKAVPAPFFVDLLVDTGCSQTVIDQRIVAGLGLPLLGTQGAITPSSGPGGVIVPIYAVSIIIPGLRGQQLTLGACRVSSADFSGQSFGGLLGRDILVRGRMYYSGPDASCYISF